MTFHDVPLTVSTPDADLYLERVGPEDAPVVAFVHGGPGYGSFSFRDLIGDELERYQTIYFDQRGGGRSYAGGPFTVHDVADDVDIVLRAVRARDVTLLAHGFGAIVAILAAATRPERIARLVLVNPWASMPLLARTLRDRAVMEGSTEGPAEARDAFLDPSVAAEGDPEAWVDEAFALVPAQRLLDALQFPRPTSRMRLEHSDAVAQYGPQDHAVPLEMWRADALDALGGLTIPVVTLFGTGDGTSYPHQAEAIWSRLPTASAALLDVGHYPWLDDPNAFLEVFDEVMSTT